MSLRSVALRRSAIVVVFLCLSFGPASWSPGQTPRLSWSDDGQRCCFKARDEHDKPQFYLIDVSRRQRTLAFDSMQLAAEVAKSRSEPTDASRVEVRDIDFAENDVLKLSTSAGVWQLDLRTNEYTQTSEETADSAKPLFLPPEASTNGGESVTITIRNESGSNLELFWIDTRGREVSYGVINAGDARSDFQTYAGHVWLLKSASGQQLGCFVSQAAMDWAITAETLANVTTKPRAARRNRARGTSRGRDARPSNAADRQWQAFVRDHDLWLRQIADNDDAEFDASKDGTEFRLTEDANEQHTFRRTASTQRMTQMRYDAQDDDDEVANVRWSPNAQHLLAYQTRVVPERVVYYIESSPRGSLQPQLQNYTYAKPGDELPIATVRLFDADQQLEIPLSNEMFSQPFSVQFLRWSDSGDRCWMLYNERGHQCLRVLEIDVLSGTVRTVVEETSETFIQYSDAGKKVLEFLGDEANDQLLWASERSGWNHLYRYKISTGEILNVVTEGEWNVKRIERIDEGREQIWFYAVGIRENQDPYHEHFCRINFDGSELTILTEGDGTHRVEFENDDQYLLDTYSRVDLAPVVELRDSTDGQLICELQRGNATGDFKTRPLTERFVAKGRDGTTDIWGIIHFPRNYDPQQKYPVVENIYAGPHDHHVPKTYRSRYRHQHQIADAGMIVVQIDGMGTAWRSKAFHDVCYKNLRDAGLPDRIAWIKAAAEKYPAMDTSRVGIYGGSAGGQNAMAALLWHHDFYKVAVADCGCHDNRMDKIWWNEQWMGLPGDGSYVKNSNMENAHLLQGDLMLIVGELDRNVDPATTSQVVGKLIEADKDFEFVLVVGAGHGAAETQWGTRKRLEFLKNRLLHPNP